LTEQELIAKLPKCHFCKRPMGEGSRLKQDGGYLYLCDTCRAFLSAIVHDRAYNVFADIQEIMAGKSVCWEETLESWCYSEEAEKT
jgi:hypothetical protein